MADKKRTRGRSKKNVKQGQNWLEQIKTYKEAVTSVPAKIFLDDIFVPTKGGKITNASFSEGALDLLYEIVAKKADGPGEVVVDYDDYNEFGSELSANFFGVEEDQNPDLISRLANLNPADELKFTLGTAKVEVDESGKAKVKDQYDFNSWAYFGEGLNENGQYNTYTPEEFEDLGITLSEALKDTLKNSPSKYQAVRNFGFLFGSKDYKDPQKDEGKKVEVDLGVVIHPKGSDVKVSPRPPARPLTGPTEEKLLKDLKDIEEDLPALGSMMDVELIEDEELMSRASEYLSNLPEEPFAPATSLRPKARPREEEEKVSQSRMPKAEELNQEKLMEYLSKVPEEPFAPATSLRPKARPRGGEEVVRPTMSRTDVPQDALVPDTDSMSFSEAFRYYVDETDQDIFTWRGKDYKAERAYAEGGMVDDGRETDPISGNEIPAGSTAEEVRDTVDAKLSEGEYVVPADVVQYYGVKFFEDLRTKAKTDLQDMESRGRIGGEPVMEGEGDLTPEEMAMLQEALSGDAPAVGMAEGGLVERLTTPAFGANTGFETRQYINLSTGSKRSFMFLDGQPVVDIPEGFVPYTGEVKKQQEQQEEAKTEGTRNDNSSDTREDKMSPARDKDTEKESWNPGVDLTDPDKALEYAKSQAEMGLGQKVASAGAMLGGPLGLAAGAFSAASQLESISNIRAAAQIQEAQGNREKAKEIMNLTKGFKIEGGLIDDIFASGRKKSYSYMTDPNLGGGLSRDMFKSDESFQESLQRNAPAGMTWTGSSYQRDDNKGYPESLGERLGGTRVDTGNQGTPVFEPGKDTVRPQSRPGSSRPASRPSSTPSQDKEDEKNSSGGIFGGYTGLKDMFDGGGPGRSGKEARGYNKGGLVKKPAPEGKKSYKKKGLASRPTKK